MKIVTYNLRSGGRNSVHWNEILECVHPEILLVQESRHPEEHLPRLFHGARYNQAVWAAAEAKGGTRRWGSGVFFESHCPVALELPEFRGWVTAAEIESFVSPAGDSRRLRVFSLHAPTGMGTYASVVNQILDMVRDFCEGYDVIIGGDFNVTVSASGDPQDRRPSAAELKIQARLREEFGLISCWDTANPDVVPAQTLRWTSNPALRFHCDGLFVPRSWSPRLRSCSVLSGDNWNRLSDHNPVVAEFRSDFV